MKRLAKLLIPLTLSLLLPPLSGADQLVKKPRVEDGHFWVYREEKDPLPFIPHGWMPAQAPQMIKVFDLGHLNNPRSGQTSVAVTIEWEFPWWAGVAWITEDQWWGETDQGTVYDLTDAKRLVFSLRGKTGNERIQVQLGILRDKRFGDEIKRDGIKLEEPIESKWLTLTKEWREYTLDLDGFSLKRIANGFTFVTSMRQQANEAAPLSFFIDDVYFAFSAAPVDSRGNFVMTWGKIKQSF